MTKRISMTILACALLGGCVATTAAEDRPLGEDVPEALRAVAAPGQNLATARVRPEDGCYWYSYEGPVETTLLPVRTRDGRPICTQRA